MLEERISQYTKNMISTWEVSEQIIDEERAMWCIKKPGSQYQKVCLYRDGKDMFIYGDYGQYSFDHMTWKGDVYNLPYDCLPYLMEKMNYESKETAYEFKSDVCEKNILDWFQERLENRYELDEELIQTIIDKTVSDEISYYLEENNLEDELEEITSFVSDALNNTADQYDWIAFLRNNDDRLSLFDESCESDLWKAGKQLSGRFLVSLYALNVCGEKLSREKEMINNKELEELEK